MTNLVTINEAADTFFLSNKYIARLVKKGIVFAQVEKHKTFPLRRYLVDPNDIQAWLDTQDAIAEKFRKQKEQQKQLFNPGDFGHVMYRSPDGRQTCTKCGYGIRIIQKENIYCEE